MNTREAIPLPKFELSGLYPEERGREVLLYVDTKLAKKLMVLLSNDTIKKKFRQVAEFVLSDNYDKDVYGHEQHSGKSKDVYAIKICVVGNHRIYCKEFYYPGQKRVVMIHYEDKKVEKLDKRLQKMVDRIGGYEYDFKS